MEVERPMTCPQCGNKKDITFNYLEWKSFPVLGLGKEAILIDNDGSEHVEIGGRGVWEGAKVTRVPENCEDAAHFHCSKCGVNWYETTEKEWV